ncbi:MAG: hypothetical protein H6737_11930 [Alphaproteobacteria bacterium]|nr:hypothetical protein [Alphaproteobacteria bacterium]
MPAHIACVANRTRALNHLPHHVRAATLLSGNRVAIAVAAVVLFLSALGSGGDPYLLGNYTALPGMVFAFVVAREIWPDRFARGTGGAIWWRLGVSDGDVLSATVTEGQLIAGWGERAEQVSLSDVRKITRHGRTLVVWLRHGTPVWLDGDTVAEGDLDRFAVALEHHHPQPLTVPPLEGVAANENTRVPGPLGDFWASLFAIPLGIVGAVCTLVGIGHLVAGTAVDAIFCLVLGLPPLAALPFLQRLGHTMSTGPVVIAVDAARLRVVREHVVQWVLLETLRLRPGKGVRLARGTVPLVELSEDSGVRAFLEDALGR